MSPAGLTSAASCGRGLSCEGAAEASVEVTDQVTPAFADFPVGYILCMGTSVQGGVRGPAELEGTVLGQNGRQPQQGGMLCVLDLLRNGCFFFPGILTSFPVLSAGDRELKSSQTFSFCCSFLFQQRKGRGEECQAISASWATSPEGDSLFPWQLRHLQDQDLMLQGYHPTLSHSAGQLT